MSAPELCPAILHNSEEERVICMLQEPIPNSWGFICSGCWEAMLDRKAAREEWELDWP
jgi:hypothetical protein